MKIKPENCAKYGINPLIQVIAQIRFQPLLAIGKDGPVAIQSRLGDLGYPQLRKEEPPFISVTFSPEGAPSASDGVPPIQNSGQTIYHFSSTDSKNTFTICADFIAFTTARYQSWADFQNEIIRLVQAFSEIYSPLVVSRIGLRYQDLIEREFLGLHNVKWGDLLSPMVAGFFATTEFVEEMDELGVEQQASQTLLRLEDCNLLLQSALLRSTTDEKQRAVLIDSDFYREHEPGTTIEDAMKSLTAMHSNANNVFRKCIKEPLHAALHPDQ